MPPSGECGCIKYTRNQNLCKIVALCSFVNCSAAFFLGVLKLTGALVQLTHLEFIETVSFLLIVISLTDTHRKIHIHRGTEKHRHRQTHGDRYTERNMHRYIHT